MGKLVDLKSKPYYLNSDDIDWVERTIEEMSIDEKIGQLFFQLFIDIDEKNVKELLRKIPLGGARYLNKSSREIQKFTGYLQKHSKIPMFVACNCDNGGDGCCSDGTYIASGAHCEAANSDEVSFNAGYVAGREATAIGCNWNFDPCSDILFNWRNTIINTRAYGKDKDVVIRHIKKYVEGMRISNMITCIKHFPGDGTEERDQHLVLGVNELSVDDWENSYGDVYRAMIDHGIHTMMAGHIALPEYQKKINPDLKYEDIMPATLSPELINDLLKTKLNFNGLVITDASHMMGMFGAMPRKDQLPKAIAAGCDMFLYLNDVEEDFQFMKDGYENGVITDERLNDALRRILGLKAWLGLHKIAREKLTNPDIKNLEVVGCKEHHEMAEEAADLGISLIKDTQNNLPLNPITHPKIQLYYLTQEEIGLMGKASTKPLDLLVSELEKVGFKVTVNKRGERQKPSIAQYKKDVDIALVVSDIRGYAVENNYRIRWSCAMANEIPWYVHEVPTIFVSLNYTTHLTDVTMVKTFINAYSNTEHVIKALVQKLIGNSEFKGIFNDNVWCKKWEAKR